MRSSYQPASLASASATDNFAVIRVVGVGGGGCNTVQRMIHSKMRGIEFIVVNTDAQQLANNDAAVKIQIGKETTRGLGSGADPEIGRHSAEENKDEVYEALRGSDMVFVTCGMGGGTGTGAAPYVAEISKEMGALTVGVVTKPFTFEGQRRRKIAELGIQELKDKVDTLITIPNDRLLQVIDKKTSMIDAFSVVDDILRQGVQGISDIITQNGFINVDFADVKTIMQDAGSALMGIGRGSGDNRAIEAARMAIESPLLEMSIDGAKGILFTITGGTDLGMYEIDEAAKAITDAADSEANIIFGALIDESMQGEVKITVIATGFDAEMSRRDRRFVINNAPQPGQQAPMNGRGQYADQPQYAPQNQMQQDQPLTPYAQRPTPQFDQHQQQPEQPQSRYSQVMQEEPEAELDVPTFIRRKLK